MSCKPLNRARSNWKDLYVGGFREMTIGRTLWKIILIKIVVLMTVVRFGLLPDRFARQFSEESQKAEHVMTVLTTQHKPGR